MKIVVNIKINMLLFIQLYINLFSICFILYNYIKIKYFKSKNYENIIICIIT